MSTLARVMLVGNIARVEHKQVNGKDLAEFYMEDIGLRCVAWEGIAKTIPAAGSRIIAEGRLASRNYESKGEARTTTEIKISAVEVIAAVAAVDDAADPF